jgi:hypothetical protein
MKDQTKCNISPAEDHNFLSLKREWQDREPVDGRVLSFSKEILVCTRCGKVIDPFSNQKPGGRRD